MHDAMELKGLMFCF